MYFDTHAHLDQEHFDADRDQVFARARQAGVKHQIAVGVDAQSSARCAKLAEHYQGCYAAVGIQPNYVHEAKPGDWDVVLELAQQPGVVALGETGLDRYWDDAPFDLQQDYFDRHLRYSQAVGLPFVVHMRDCEEDVFVMLREAASRGPLSGVMHSYTGTAEGAAEAISLGLYVSFAGMVTYKKSDTLRKVAATVPVDRLLIETDSPYLSPEPVRKIRRNEPAHVVHTCACLADLFRITSLKLAEATTKNAKRLFQIE